MPYRREVLLLLSEAEVQVVDQRRVIALDGKSVRGARSNDQTAPHLVAAFDHTAATVLGQVATKLWASPRIVETSSMMDGPLARASVSSVRRWFRR